jgi:ATP-dependent DNA helicase Rep
MINLNPQQQEAITHHHGPLLVLAGAGSGKTRVITHKIVHLISTVGINPKNIIAVTFTNKAAQEMKSRVNSLFTDKKNKGLFIATFHQLGLKILQREHKELGLRSKFSIFDAEDSRNLLKDLAFVTVDDSKTPIELLQHQISMWKNELLTPEQALDVANTPELFAAAKLYSAYQQALRAYNSVDFDDLIFAPVQLLANNPELKEKWQNTVRYMLVDEYQDTNSAQYELIKLLCGVSARFTVVGDDDQSIYAWRGARPDNLEELKKDFPQLAVIKLEQNYRSTQRILRCANTLIKQNPHLFEKNLWSTLAPGEKLRIIRTKDEHSEVSQVVSEIVSRRYRENSSYGDFAILYRSNHQARPFEQALREQSVPYTLSGGQSFFSKTEIKDVVAYCRLVINPDDDAAFLRIINTPRREIGATTIEKLNAYASMRKCSLLSACHEMGLAEYVSARAMDNLREFAVWIETMQRLFEEENHTRALQQLLTDIDYNDWILENSPSAKNAEKRLQNVQDLVNWMQRLLDHEEQEHNFESVLHRVTLIDLMERNESKEEDDRVQLMTLHAAKGLEFKHVFLVGMEEGILPHQNSIDNDDIEEERRLAYVGITRAQQSLALTLTHSRRRQGDKAESQPSRFLEELEADDLQWEGFSDKKDPQRSLEVGKSHLESLKAMLGG